MTIDHFDCRTGGSYRYVHSRDGEEFGFHGCFHEVRPNELIVQTFTFEGLPDGVALEKLVLEDLGDGRTRLDRDLAGRLLRGPRRVRRQRHGDRRRRGLRAPRRGCSPAAEPAAHRPQEIPMDMKLELVPIPVTDVDRAKAFYTDQLGFVADVDVTPGARCPGGAADPSGFGVLDRAGHRPRRLRGGSPGRSGPCTWSSRTSRRPARSWSVAGSTSARCRTSAAG